MFYASFYDLAWDKRKTGEQSKHFYSLKYKIIYTYLKSIKLSEYAQLHKLIIMIRLFSDWNPCEWMNAAHSP